MFGGTFDPKTPIFNIFGNFAGDDPISWSHPDPIQKLERVKIGSKRMSTKVSKFRAIRRTRYGVIADQSAGGL